MESLTGEEAMDVVERVHIAPLGFERDRILDPARSYNADRIVLIEHVDDTERRDYHQKLIEKLEASNIDVETTKADIFGLYSTIGTVAELIRQYEGHNVYVNLASGSKVAAIGGMIACMAEGAVPYYVHAEQYVYEESKPISSGVKSTRVMPADPMEHPEPERIFVLQQLREDGPLSKKALIAVGREYDLPFVRHLDDDGDSMRGEYRRLESHIIEPLLEDGYIEIEEAGQRRLAHITEKGDNTLEAFEYLIGTETM